MLFNRPIGDVVGYAVREPNDKALYPLLPIAQLFADFHDLRNGPLDYCTIGDETSPSYSPEGA